MMWVTCLARQTLVIDSPCPVVDTAPDSLSAYAPAPTGLLKDVKKNQIFILVKPSSMVEYLNGLHFVKTTASLAHSLIFNYCLLQVKEDRLFEPNSLETSLIKFQLYN